MSVILVIFSFFHGKYNASQFFRPQVRMISPRIESQWWHPKWHSKISGLLFHSLAVSKSGSYRYFLKIASKMIFCPFHLFSAKLSIDSFFFPLLSVKFGTIVKLSLTVMPKIYTHLWLRDLQCFFRNLNLF